MSGFRTPAGARNSPTKPPFAFGLSNGKSRQRRTFGLPEPDRERYAAAHRQRTEADQAREAMQIAPGTAEQPAFVSKTRARWQETKRRYEAAAERLDRSADRENRKRARDVRQFIKDRASIETIRIGCCAKRKRECEHMKIEPRPTRSPIGACHVAHARPLTFSADRLLWRDYPTDFE